MLLRPALYAELFDADADRTLRGLGEVEFNAGPRDPAPEELARRLPGCTVVVTGWGTPAFTDAVLDAAPSLKLISHSAGTVKGLIPTSIFDRGVAVTHAAAAIAPAVADFCLASLQHQLRHPWNRGKGGIGTELAETRVGIIGASMTGRSFIELLKPFGCDVRVFDPYLSDADAAALGVTQRSLAELLAECPAVSAHAPSTPETRKMLGAKEFALLPDGAVFINTARSWMLDEDALLKELETGRIQAALDVFDREPVPEDSPFRKLGNVVVTNHIAGATKQSRLRQGRLVVDEIQRFANGAPLRYAVTRERWATMA